MYTCSQPFSLRHLLLELSFRPLLLLLLREHFFRSFRLELLFLLRLRPLPRLLLLLLLLRLLRLGLFLLLLLCLERLLLLLLRPRFCCFLSLRLRLRFRLLLRLLRFLLRLRLRSPPPPFSNARISFERPSQRPRPSSFCACSKTAFFCASPSDPASAMNRAPMPPKQRCIVSPSRSFASGVTRLASFSTWSAVSAWLRSISFRLLETSSPAPSSPSNTAPQKPQMSLRTQCLPPSGANP
mmetsp:Transcript_147914/g.474917  ORF Transcript_147914/g.474917 Transcript_147914/m.474917 type:complete len:240 (+) Transcript_147914:11-730(+)